MKQNKILVEYSSNNSGGGWWLKDNDWKALEKAGWKVNWYNNPKDCYECHGTGIVSEGLFKGKKCFTQYHNKDGRFLGGLSSSASKRVNSITEALKEFEKVTGQDVSKQGCNCCGPPHSFTWSSSGCTTDKCDCFKNNKKGPHKDYNYASGEGLLEYLYPGKKVPKSIRETIKD